MIFCNRHHGGQLTTTHYIFCYFFMCLFLQPLLWRCQLNNHLYTSGFQRISRKHIYKGGFDDQHMGLIIVIWSLMVIDEHKDDVMFQWIQRQHNFPIMEKCWLFTVDRQMDLGALIWSIIILYEHNSDYNLWWRIFWLLLWDTTDDTSAMTCHFEADVKGIYPDRKIVLNLWWREKFGHCCGPSLMDSLLWVVVIYHRIFLTRRVSFCYIWIGVKECWFDMGYRTPNYSYMKMFIEFFVVIGVKDSIDCWLYELHQIPLVLY